MKNLVGTGGLVRLALRRDRLRLTGWVVGLSVLIIATASALGDFYPDPGSRRLLAESVARNPALLSILGPLFDADSIGGLTAWRGGFVPTVLIPLMALVTVIRHTRGDEESGRRELLGSTVVGHYAPLTAALLVTFGASLAIGGMTAVGLIGLGETTSGAVALGASYAAAGWIFAAIAAVTAQLTQAARAAIGIAIAALGTSYVLRATGDADIGGGLSWLSWVSPTGWTLQTRPFADERWWVFGLIGAFVLVAVTAAYALVSRRDIGAGLLPARSGPAQAHPGLSGSFALARRLHRGPMLAWLAGFAAIGAAYGSVAEGIGDLVADNPLIEEIFTRLGGGEALVDAFLATTMSVIGLLAAVYAVQAVLHLRSEETEVRAEPLLAAGVGRVRWALSHLVLAAGGAALVLAVAGLAEGVVHGMRSGDIGTEVVRLVGAALAQLPAVLVMAGIATLLFGAWPHMTAASWAALATFLILGQLGPILRLDQWVMNASPFTHLPNLPGDEISAAPFLWLTAAAAILIAGGLVAFRLRDVG